MINGVERYGFLRGLDRVETLTYMVKCDECKVVIKERVSFKESVAGGKCSTCS